MVIDNDVMMMCVKLSNCDEPREVFQLNTIAIFPMITTELHRPFQEALLD